MAWFHTQSHRMELYTVAALLFTFLGFSHVVWGWPPGASQSVSDNPVPGWPAMLTPDFIWRCVFVLSLVAVGFLYYKGRKIGAFGSNSAVADLQKKYQEADRSSNAHEKAADVYKKLMESEQVKTERLTKTVADCQRDLERLSHNEDASIPNIQVIRVWIVEEPGANYPLKIRYQMKNASPKCADVTMQGCQLNNPVMLREVLFDVLQVHYAIGGPKPEWVPKPIGIVRMALLPGQQFRGWVAANDTIFKKDQVEKLIGGLGAVILYVNDNVVEVKI